MNISITWNKYLIQLHNTLSSHRIWMFKSSHNIQMCICANIRNDRINMNSPKIKLPPLTKQVEMSKYIHKETLQGTRKDGLLNHITMGSKYIYHDSRFQPYLYPNFLDLCKQQRRNALWNDECKFQIGLLWLHSHHCMIQWR